MAKTSLHIRRFALAALAVVLAALTYAWIDGGEEPMRPMAQNIALPGSVMGVITGVMMGVRQ